MNNKTPLATSLNRLLPALTATLGAALLASCAQFGLPKPEVAAATPSVERETGLEPQGTAQALATQEPAKPAPATQPAPSPLYVWKGQGRWVSRIEINVDEQKAHFYDGDQEIGWTTIASGLRTYPTPTGKFSVQEKVEEKQSNLYGKIYDRNGRLIRAEAKADVDPVPPGGRFEGAKMPFFLRLTGDGIGLHAGPIPRPGSRASHGCIRMPKSFAPILFEHVKIGTPATIVGDGPSYGTYLAQQQARNQARIARAAKPATPADKAAPGAPAAAPEGSATVAEAPAPDKETVAKAAPAPAEGTSAVAKTVPAESATTTTKPAPAASDKKPTPAEPAPAAAKSSHPAADKAAVSGDPAPQPEKKAATPEPAPAVAEKKTPAEPPKAPASTETAPAAVKKTPSEPEAAPKGTPAAGDKGPAAVSTTPAPAATPPAPPTAPTPPAKPAAAAPATPVPSTPATPPPSPAMAGEKPKAPAT